MFHRTSVTYVFHYVINNADVPQPKNGFRKCGLFTKWNTTSAIKIKHIMNFANPKGHAWYVLTDKWISNIEYKIHMLYSTD